MQTEKKINSINKGDIINGYKIIQKLGSGGYGGVYLAHNNLTNQTVAIKIFNIQNLIKKFIKIEKDRNKAEKIVTQKIIDEISVLNDLTVTNQCEYLVKYYDSFRDDDYWYIIMEYINGTKLDTFSVEKGGLLENSVSWPLMLQLILGLKHIHDLGYAHRDITVDNLLITDDYKVKYIDFGITCVEECFYPDCLNKCSNSGYDYDDTDDEIFSSLKIAQIRDVRLLIYCFYDIYLGNVGWEELQIEEEVNKNMNIQQQWSFREKFLNPNFDDGRTGVFLRMIYNKNYDINTVLDLFLKNIIAKPW